MADHLIKESGVRPLLHCFAVEAIMDGDTIKVINYVLKCLKNSIPFTNTSEENKLHKHKSIEVN